MWTLSKHPYFFDDALVQVKRLYDRFGAKRLMWGTDWQISLKQPEYAKAVELYRDRIDLFRGRTGSGS